MQPDTLFTSNGEDSITALHTLSSSLHTLSLASLRELLLSCALENEQVAAHINTCLHSQNGLKSTPYNLENFKFHTGSTDSLSSSSSDSPSSSCPPSPELGNSQTITSSVGDNNAPNYSTPYTYSAYNGSLKSSGGISKGDTEGKPKVARIPSWNWSYYYYKESSTGATAKRDDVDEGTPYEHIFNAYF